MHEHGVDRPTAARHLGAWALAVGVATAGCSKDEPTAAPRPGSTPIGTLLVSAPTTGQDAPLGAFRLAVRDLTSSRLVFLPDSEPEIRRDGTDVRLDLREGRYLVTLVGLTPNCGVADGATRQVDVAGGDSRRAVFTVSCAAMEWWPGGPGHARDLEGEWRAVRWEFRDSATGAVVGEVASGDQEIAGATFTAGNERQLAWHWRQRDWFEPDYMVKIDGEAFVADGLLLAEAVFPQDVTFPDDPQGPLHGEHRFSFRADSLVIERVEPIRFFDRWVTDRYATGTSTITLVPRS